MTLLYKFVNDLSGWSGAPGVNVVFFSAGTSVVEPHTMCQEAYTELHNMYVVNKAYLVAGVTVAVARDVQVIETVTGELQDVITIVGPETDVVGTGVAGNLSRGTQALVRFSTDHFANGRRLIGRMFLGPIAAGCFDEEGKIAPSVRTGIDNSFVAMTSGIGPRLAVYHRPTKLLPLSGFYGDVVSADCVALPGNLSKRRN